MMLSYTRLFEVSLLHDYFLDGVAKGIRLIPTAETAELMKKGRMISRQTPKGLLVLYSSEEDRVTPEVALTTPVHFHFWVQSDDPTLFFAVTDLRKGGRTFKSGDCLAFRSVPANASEDQANPEKIQLDLWDGIRPKSQSIRLSLSPVPPKDRAVIVWYSTGTTNFPCLYVPVPQTVCLRDYSHIANHLCLVCVLSESALSDPTQLGTFKERCNVRYNYACACALCGKHQEAEEQLRLLAAWQAVEASDLLSDEDLTSVRALPWFQQLVAPQ